MALRVIKTTDRQFEGLEFPFSIDSLPSEISVAGATFDSFKILNMSEGIYKLYNSHYVVIVKEI